MFQYKSQAKIIEEALATPRDETAPLPNSLRLPDYYSVRSGQPFSTK